MPNSISTTSNTQTTTNTTPATFNAGDIVLCPSLSLNPFVLINDPYGKRKLLAFIHYEKIETHVAILMARLTHDNTETWHELLQSQLGSIKETLAMTSYGKEGSQ